MRYANDVCYAPTNIIITMYHNTDSLVWGFDPTNWKVMSLDSYGGVMDDHHLNRMVSPWTYFQTGFFSKHFISYEFVSLIKYSNISYRSCDLYSRAPEWETPLARGRKKAPFRGSEA